MYPIMWASRFCQILEQVSGHHMIIRDYWIPGSLGQVIQAAMTLLHGDSAVQFV